LNRWREYFKQLLNGEEETEDKKEIYKTTKYVCSEQPFSRNDTDSRDYAKPKEQ
jgi:hypothetical protein